MSDLTATPRLVAHAYDRNRNGHVSDDLTISAEALAATDANKNGKVETTELANALGNDRVIISGGKVEASEGARVPRLYGEQARIAEVGNNALLQTANWYVPQKPNRDYYYSQPEYQAALDKYSVERSEYKDKIKTDKAILETTLTTLLATSRDPEVREIAREALSHDILRDLLVNDNKIARYETDRAILRTAIKNIVSITEGLDVGARLDQTNGYLRGAEAAVQEEDSTLRTGRESALQRGVAKLKELEKAWFFKGTRQNNTKETMDRIKGYETASKTNALADLARRTYETGVSLLGGYSKPEARATGEDLRQLGLSVGRIEAQAKTETKEVRNFAK